MTSVSITTNANIALIKYWGKRNEELILPTKDSISIGVAALTTTTSIQLNKTTQDKIIINNNSNNDIIKPITLFLDTIRKKFNFNKHFTINSYNNFPTASGLASSASGFAALAFGINHICNLNLNFEKISILARQGSGSASRSIFGGFSIWHSGSALDGSDSYAEQIAKSSSWQSLQMMIVITTDTIKTVSSRQGMQASIQTSDYYAQWIKESSMRIAPMKQAIITQNFTQLGQLTEHDWEGFFNVINSTKPALNYWNSTSILVINEIKKLRKNGYECYFTTDAGPHIIIFYLSENESIIKKKLKKIPGIKNILQSNIANEPIVKII